MKAKLILCTFFLSLVILSNAQKIISQNNQQWIQYYNQLILSKKLTLYSDVSLRRINNFSQWSQITIRSGIAYSLSENLHGVTGFACFNLYANNKPSRIEFRPYQEINSWQKFKNVSIQHRLRGEARFFRNISDGAITSRSNFNFRFRYRFYCGIPITKFFINNADKKILLNIGDEIFINAGKEIINNMLDNNRLLIGSTFQFSNNLSFSLTYNYQFGQRSTPKTYEHSDIFWLGIMHKLSLKK